MRGEGNNQAGGWQRWRCKESPQQEGGGQLPLPLELPLELLLELPLEMPLELLLELLLPPPPLELLLPPPLRRVII